MLDNMTIIRATFAKHLTVNEFITPEEENEELVMLRNEVDELSSLRTLDMRSTLLTEEVSTLLTEEVGALLTETGGALLTA